MQFSSLPFESEPVEEMWEVTAMYVDPGQPDADLLHVFNNRRGGNT
jgi:hypothetical protein